MDWVSGLLSCGPEYVLDYWKARGEGMCAEEIEPQEGFFEYDVYSIEEKKKLPDGKDRPSHTILDVENRPTKK